jgi:DNA polymerase beta
MLQHSSHVHIPIPSAPKPAEGTWQRGRGVHSPAFRDKSRPGKLALQDALLTQRVIEPLTIRGIIATHTHPGITRWEGVVRVPTNGETTFRKPVSKYMPVTTRHTRLNITCVPSHFDILDISKDVISMLHRLVPTKCRGSALLALTGDESFYLDIRRRAQKMGMHLNEYGLWRWESNSPSVDDDSGHWKLEHVETEQDILQSVGLAWVDPTRRNFDYLQLHSNAKPVATRPRGRPWHKEVS